MSRLRLLAVLAALIIVEATPAEAGGPYQFYSLAPCRIVDTRNPDGLTGGPALLGGTQRNFPISAWPAACGVPASATAAALNVTMVGPTASGFLVIWPFQTPIPLVSNINANAGEPAIANSALAPLTADPSFNVSVVYGTAGGGSCHVIIDVTDFYQ